MKTMHTAAILTFAMLAGSALADAVTSRADLGADDNIQWGQFGPPFTIIDTPAAGLSDGGLSFTVDTTSDLGLIRYDQGDGWDGNFSPDDELIVTDFAAAIVIDFETPIFGVGVNIQAEFFGGFQGTLEVFDTDGNLIERFTREGESNENADGSAIFIGILSDTPIARAVFYADTSGAAINIGGLVTIPAPSSLAPLALAGLVATRRRR